MGVIYDKDIYDELALSHGIVQYGRQVMDAAAARRRVAINVARTNGIGLYPISEIFGITVSAVQQIVRKSRPDDRDWLAMVPPPDERFEQIAKTMRGDAKPIHPEHRAAVEAQIIVSGGTLLG